MERRGNRIGAKDKAAGNPSEGMKPERYMESLLQEEARTINIIRSAARWHLEARKFLLDLANLPELRPSAPGRRA
jgi:hypothetical protein